MKKGKLFFVFLLIFSLLIINGKEYECVGKSSSFNEVERYILNEYEFINNGIKLEYTIKDDINSELERIFNVFKGNGNFQIKMGENYIHSENNNINYEVNIYNYNELTKVEVIVINNNKTLTEDYLKSLAKEIRNINFIDERYFSFIKGKLDIEEKEAFKDLENKLKIKVSESLDINNGVVAKASMMDGTDINIGQITYDSGSYLIIGTPIIFVTY